MAPSTSTSAVFGLRVKASLTTTVPASKGPATAGVTEITLSDGRLVRATLHVKGVKIDPNKPGSVDVAYNIVAEIVNRPDVPIHAVHETIQ